MKCTFEAAIDHTDIEMINSVRLAINMIIGSESEVHTWTNDDRNLRALQQKACEKLLKVITRSRARIEEPEYYRKPYKWNQVRAIR